MRVTYQSGEVYLSMTKEEADHIHENKGKPVPIGVRTLKILHEDVSNCVKAHWSNVEVPNFLFEIFSKLKTILVW